MSNNNNDKKSTKPKKDLSKLRRKNKIILEKVKMWQSFPYVKPLICQNEACNSCKLKPKETKTRIMLQCPKCKKIQNYVPRIVLKTKLSIPDVLIKNKRRYAHKASLRE
jgi:hypothetical protein